jgi:hypothetical protein
MWNGLGRNFRLIYFADQSDQNRFGLVPIHRLITSGDVEAHKPSQLEEGEDTPPHELVDVADAAPVVSGNFRLVEPFGHFRSGLDFVEHNFVIR